MSRNRSYPLCIVAPAFVAPYSRGVYAPDHEAARFVELVRALKSEHPSDARVARMVGVSRAYVGRLLAADKPPQIREQTIAGACKALGLPMTFFRSDSPVKDWRSWVREPIEMSGPVAASSLTEILSDAQAWLMFAHEGRPVPPERFRELAKAVLEHELVTLAHEVLAAPPERVSALGFALAAAIARAVPPTKRRPMDTNG